MWPRMSTVAAAEGVTEVLGKGRKYACTWKQLNTYTRAASYVNDLVKGVTRAMASVSGLSLAQLDIPEAVALFDRFLICNIIFLDLLIDVLYARLRAIQFAGDGFFDARFRDLR